MTSVTVTDTAAAVIRTLAARRDPPCGAQLRIARDDHDGQLTAQLVAEPHCEDRVVHGQGVRVFLDPHASKVLAGKTLDAQAGTNGYLTFTIEDRTD
jgi:Fe-S cluster assembly iron-binding protein IscA